MAAHQINVDITSYVVFYVVGLLWMCNQNNVRYEIIYPFPNFNGYTMDDWEWISKFIPHITGYVITYQC